MTNKNNKKLKKLNGKPNKMKLRERRKKMVKNLSQKKKSGTLTIMLHSKQTKFNL